MGMLFDATQGLRHTSLFETYAVGNRFEVAPTFFRVVRFARIAYSIIKGWVEFI
jgi:hypothetical protein